MKKTNEVTRITTEVTRPPSENQTVEINFELHTNFWEDFFEMLDIDKKTKKIARTSKNQFQTSNSRMHIRKKRTCTFIKKAKSHRA